MGTFNPLLLACLVGVLSLVGCHSPVQAQAPPRRLAHAHAAEVPVICPTFPEVSAQWIVMILWDRSGSVQQLTHDQTERIRTDAMALIEHLPPATLVFGHYIAAHSYGEEGFLRDAIPAAPAAAPCQITNIWDPRQKQACRQQERRSTAQLACVTAARQRMTNTLQELTPARATSTDVWGAMAVASEIMQAYSYCHRLIVVYSDLEDNVLTRQRPGQRRNGQRAAQPSLPDLPGLRGVTVVVRTPRTDPAVAARHVRAFQRHLTGWGATVTAVPFEVPWQSALSNNS